MSASNFPKTEIAQRGTIRLIPSGRLKPPVLEYLVDTHGDREDISLLESFTNDRLTGAGSGLLDVEGSELLTQAYGWGATYINAAFLHPRPKGSRFNGPERGAWYASFDVRTSLAEVSFHLSREVEATGRLENITDFTELVADFIGTFHDCRDLEGPLDYLHPDIQFGYPAGQALAQNLRREDSRGLIYPSVRHKGGICLAAFKPTVVQNLQQGALWRLEWQGGPEPSIVKLESR